MIRMRLFAAGALVACAASGAGAGPPKHERTTCHDLERKFDPPARPGWDACHNQHFFDDAFDASMSNAENDQPVVVYRARGTARYELLVLFPGGGGTPEHYDGFMTRAAELGYDVVGLGVHSSQNALDGTPVHTQPGDICGCFGACYGKWHARQFSGGVGGGRLPPVPQPSSIKQRLRRVLEHYRGAQGWPGHDRWGTYLCNDRSGDCEPGEINWRKVVLAGHSDGTRVSTYIASQVRVRKVILFSGIPESAGKRQGCEGCEPIIGPDYDPPLPQTYSKDKCKPHDAPPDYIREHDFGGHEGTPYATGRERFWALVDAADLKCSQKGSTRTLGEAGLTLNQLHDPGLADGFAFWGPHAAPDGTYAASPQNDFRGHHVIMANDLCGDVDAAHNATVQDGKCSGIGAVYRGDIWHFLLTR